jgi:hypothetical protein
MLSDSGRKRRFLSYENAKNKTTILIRTIGIF